MFNRKTAQRRNRKGAAAVEFALVVPFFIVLLFGIVEFGRAMMVQQTLTNAAREAARVAVIPGTTTSEAKAAAISALSVTGIPCNENHITITPDPSQAFDNAQITVQVSIPFSDVSWIAGTYISANLSSTTSMRSERYE